MGYDSSSRTGTTLFVLLNDPSNQQAWEAFVDRYGPKICLWCRKWDVQDADAENVAQEVLMKLAQKIHLYQSQKGSFRGWLKMVTRRVLADYRESQGKGGGVGSGSTAFLTHLQSLEAHEDLVTTLEKEFDRELLELAQARVQLRVTPQTWDAFRLLAFQDLSGAEVAQQLGMKVAAVFVAKNRVQKMLQEEIRKLEEGEAEKS
jgi:RNA polymerase sigma-70 factor (ECF subfamily)